MSRELQEVKSAAKTRKILDMREYLRAPDKLSSLFRGKT